MTKLIKTEWLKIKGYNSFWWIMGLTALSYPGINYMFYFVYKDITDQKCIRPDFQNGAWKSICLSRSLAFGSVFLFFLCIYTGSGGDHVYQQ